MNLRKFALRLTMIFLIMLPFLLMAALGVSAQSDQPPGSTPTVAPVPAVPGTDSVLLQVFLQIVVAVAAPLLTYLILSLVATGLRWARLKMDKSQLAFVETMVRQFVKAAEHYNLKGILQQTGKEKKAWVIERVTAALRARGVMIDVAIIADLIEVAVMEEINSFPWTEYNDDTESPEVPGISLN